MIVRTIFGCVLTLMCCFGVAADASVSAAPSGYRLNSIILTELTIEGEAMATEEQCLSYLLRNNPLPSLTVTPQELVRLYYEEGEREGIRPDAAFAQAIHETGFFRYGGAVVPLQNNYCGLGTTGGGVKGAWFATAREGVRAQVQHLMAYATTRPPQGEIVDPRYDIVKRSERFGSARVWTDLNGKWAVPGRQYGQRIMRIFYDILNEDCTETVRYRYVDEVDVWHDTAEKGEVVLNGEDSSE